MNTILEDDRRFGVLAFDAATGNIAKVGCCAEIVRYQRLPDDRLKMLTLGQQRFRVLEYVREKPYRVGLVEWIEDAPPAEDLRLLVREVDRLLRDVVHLSAKLNDQPIELPDDIPTLPVQLSYWIAGNFYGAPTEQQALLEMQDTGARLRREAEILSSTRNHLAARTALKDALN